MEGEQQQQGHDVEQPDVSRADSAHVFHAQGKARVAYFDEGGNFIGYQDVTGMTKVELSLDL